jgi:hypothetical protein
VTGNRVARVAEGVGPYGSGDKTTYRGSGCKLASERGFPEANDGEGKKTGWRKTGQGGVVENQGKGERRQRKGAEENKAA